MNLIILLHGKPGGITKKFKKCLMNGSRLQQTGMWSYGGHPLLFLNRYALGHNELINILHRVYYWGRNAPNL
jgi:hypothetical protein